MLCWTLPALPLAWLLWRAAHQPVVSNAGLPCSAFDVHRLDVYKSMHWPPPSSPDTEWEHGEKLTVFLLEGAVAGEVTCTKDYSKEDPATQQGQSHSS